MLHKLIGNETLYQALAATVQGGRLSHALLVEGPPGSGKKTFAAEVAQAAVCSGEQPARPCGVCRDCVKAEKGIHPDILLFGGEGGSRSFHIDTVRALRQEAYVRPNEAGCKVMVLHDTHEMSVQAQNALLKIIEEPPKNVCFLLTCISSARMLETIRSRVQVMTVAVPGVAQCAAYLEPFFPEAGREAVAVAAERAGGVVGRAKALLQEEDSGAEAAAGLLYDICIGSELDALAALSRYERDRQGLAALMEQLAQLLREALLHPGADPRLQELAGRAGRLRLLKILAIIEDTVYAATQNVNGLLLVTGISARIRSVLAEN